MAKRKRRRSKKSSRRGSKKGVFLVQRKGKTIKHGRSRTKASANKKARRYTKRTGHPVSIKHVAGSKRRSSKRRSSRRRRSRR